jgi:hypothetical protein
VWIHFQIACHSASLNSLTLFLPPGKRKERSNPKEETKKKEKRKKGKKEIGRNQLNRVMIGSE